jgi:hypothetical protein
MAAMATDPVIGSFVWLTSSLAFLAAAAAVVRLLEPREPVAARDADTAPHEAATG